MFLLGFLASVYGIIVGAGGGFIFVPMLLFFFDISPQVAAGTGLAIVFLNSVSALYVYFKQQRVLVHKGTQFAIAAIPGTFVGSWLVNHVSEEVFHYGLATLLVGLGLFLAMKKPSVGTEKEAAAIIEGNRVFVTFIIGLLLGIVSSFFGIGGGWLLVPIMIYLFRIDPYKATATSIFALSIYSFAGVIPPMLNGDIAWNILVWSGIGVCVGAQVGALISKKLKASSITRMLALLVIVIAVLLVV
nr:sulfite exporter TauE/SafE family protein [Geomicrobium halophilum]